MNQSLSEFFASPLAWALLALIAVAGVYALYRRRGQSRTLASVLNNIAFERLESLIIPKADEGEIQIDHLILTAQGLVIIDIKDVQGNVFGSDKMEKWTVIANDSRYTFNNPQPALYDRIAAVRQVVRQVPVAGRVVFLDGASFSKGIPSLVSNLDELQAEFGDWDKEAAKVKIEAFMPHWEQIKARANP